MGRRRKHEGFEEVSTDEGPEYKLLLENERTFMPTSAEEGEGTQSGLGPNSMGAWHWRPYGWPFQRKGERKA